MLITDYYNPRKPEETVDLDRPTLEVEGTRRRVLQLERKTGGPIRYRIRIVLDGEPKEGLIATCFISKDGA